MNGTAKLAWVETKLLLREPLAAFFTLVFPVILLLVFGTIFGNVPGVAQDVGFVDAMTPGYVALIIATSSLLSLSTTLAAYREHGILRRLRVTPLRPGAVLLAQMAVMFLTTTMGVGLLLVVGRAVFSLQSRGTTTSCCYSFVFVCLCSFGLGVVLAAVATSARGAQAIGMAIFYPMIFMSGAAFPRELLPEGVQRAAVILPLTHVVTLLRASWMGEPWTAHVGSAVVLALMAAAASGLAVRLFRWE